MPKVNWKQTVTSRISVAGILLILCTITAFGQPQREWLFGYGRPGNEGWGISGLRFTDGAVTTTHHLQQPHVDLGQSGALAIGLDGNVLAYTSSCRVYDRSGRNISGSEPIRPVAFPGSYCDVDDYSGNYISAFSTLFVSLLGEEYSTLLWAAQKDFDFDLQYVYSDSTHLKLVTETANGLTYETLPTLATPRLAVSRITAVLSQDSMVWHIPRIAVASHDLFVYSIDRSNASVTVQEYPVVEERVINIGLQAAFSPRGDKYALLHDEEGLYVYDFDRRAGNFTDHRRYAIPDSVRLLDGLCFSPSGRYVYLAGSGNLFQVDLTDGAVTHIAYHFSLDEYGWPVTIGSMHLGPDCRIYVAPRQTTNLAHVIHYPDEPGRACGFEARAIRFTTRILFGWPNLPTTVDPDNCLDLAWAVDNPSSTGTPAPGQGMDLLRLFPNPASGPVRLGWTERGAQLGYRSFGWSLYDGLGRRVRQLTLAAGEDRTLDRRGLPAGLYTWTLTREGRPLQ